MATIRASIPLPSSMTVGQLIEELRQYPAHAAVDAHVTAGDRPWDSDSSSLNVSYSTPPPSKPTRPESSSRTDYLEENR